MSAILPINSCFPLQTLLRPHKAETIKNRSMSTIDLPRYKNLLEESPKN